MTQAQLMKTVSDMFRSLTPRNRKKYEEKAKLEKDRYLRDTERFTKEFNKMFSDT